MSIASEPKLCPKCGTTIPPEAPEGLCPKCLLLEISLPTEAGQGAGKSVPPTREELSDAFPHLEILELIGQGGMGFVFKARQPKLDRFVALKILPQSLAADPAFAERFTREGRLLARLNHPNIVTVHDFGVASGVSPDVEPGFQPGGKIVDKGQSEPVSNAPDNATTDPRGKMPRATSGQRRDATFFYLLMEYVDGVNLRQAMKAGRFTADQALAVVPKICEALQFAHNEGILHRDIKPENILLDTKGRVKIADFGIAKLVGMERGSVSRSGDEKTDVSKQADASATSHPAAGHRPALQDLTAAGKTLGTPNYMAPEQIATPGAVDHRADIYSLGVVFYEMLTGELPLGRFAPPSQKSAADPRLDNVVLRALEKEPNRRTQSAGEVKTQVETIATNQPPPITPLPSTSPKIKGFVRRGVMVGLFVFFLIVSATTIITFLLPKTYMGTSKVFIRADKPDLQTEMEICSSDVVLEKVVQDLNLAKKWQKGTDSPARLKNSDALALLRKSMVIETLRNSAVFSISFRSPDPVEAAEIANAIVNSYVAYPRTPTTHVAIIQVATPNMNSAKPDVVRSAIGGIYVGAFLGFLIGLMTTLFLRSHANHRTETSNEGKSQADTIATDAIRLGGKKYARWWLVSPLSSPEVLEIMAHMTKTERNEFSFYGLLLGGWVVAVTFGNLFLIRTFPAPGNWIVASVVVAIFIVSLPSMYRTQGRFLCSTAWARQRGYAAEKIKIFSFSRRNLGRVLVFVGVGILLIFGQSKLFKHLSGNAELTSSLKADAARTKEHSAQQAAQAKKKKSTFGPVIERVVKEPVAPDYEWFDLDTGRGVFPAGAFLGNDVEDAVFEDWMRKTGADIGSSVANKALVARGGNLIAVPVLESLWMSASPKAISDLVSQMRPEMDLEYNNPVNANLRHAGAVLAKLQAQYTEAHPIVREQRLKIKALESELATSLTNPVKFGANPAGRATDRAVSVFRADESLPATFAFRTREGGVGILQVTGMSENPRGVKIRYKLAQNFVTNKTLLSNSIRTEERFDIDSLDLQRAKARLLELRVQYTDNHPLVKAKLAHLRELERMAKKEPNASPALREAKADLAEKRVRFGDEHPEVKELKERVRELEEK